MTHYNFSTNYIKMQYFRIIVHYFIYKTLYVVLYNTHNSQSIALYMIYWFSPYSALWGGIQCTAVFWCDLLINFPTWQDEYILTFTHYSFFNFSIPSMPSMIPKKESLFILNCNFKHNFTEREQVAWLYCQLEYEFNNT